MHIRQILMRVFLLAALLLASATACVQYECNDTDITCNAALDLVLIRLLGNVAPNQIYAADGFTARLYRFDDPVGANQIEYNGSAGTTFVGPAGVAIDGRAYLGGSGAIIIYMVDTTNLLLYRVESMLGANQLEYNGSAGTAFAGPRGVATDSAGRIYVADQTNSLLYRFDDMAGANQVEYNGSAGTAFSGNLQGVAVDSSGRRKEIGRSHV